MPGPGASSWPLRDWPSLLGNQSSGSTNSMVHRRKRIDINGTTPISRWTTRETVREHPWIRDHEQAI